jgi:hypothetical protein
MNPKEAATFEQEWKTGQAHRTMQAAVRRRVVPWFRHGDWRAGHFPDSRFRKHYPRQNAQRMTGMRDNKTGR